jgi:acyl dehydratase
MTATTIGNDPSPKFLENHPASEIRIGDSASLERTVTQHDIRLFAAVTGDVNPAHVDALYASGSLARGYRRYWERGSPGRARFTLARR